MEKLQAALARAREQREISLRTVRRVEPAPRAAAPLSLREKKLEDRWDELESFAPDPAKMRASHIHAAEATAEAQHFDILRTKLLLEMRKNGWNRIAVTSATAGCGKTTTACNLIAGLGRQPELRGMLFDLDFRRPAVAGLFGVSPPRGLEDVLLGNADFSENALRLDPNTCIWMTNRPVEDPSKLLLRGQTADAFDGIQADYEPDLMLFDMPPVLISDETRGFLKQVDAALIIAGAETSTVAQIDEAEREVAQYTNVAGIVLNKCRFMEDGNSYGY